MKVYCILALSMCKQKIRIHGLWPNHNASDDVVSACKASIKLEVDPRVETRMKEVWPNCINPKKYYSFWRHEFCRHGIDVFDSYNEYFSLALQAYDYICKNKLYTKCQNYSKGKEMRINMVYDTLTKKWGLEKNKKCKVLKL